MIDTLRTDAGQELDAKASLSQTTDGFQLTFESRGGSGRRSKTPRYPEYTRAFELALRRLARLSAILHDGRVESRTTREWDPRDKRLAVSAWPYPIELSRVPDIARFATELRTAGARVGHKGRGGGNPTKRITLDFSLPPSFGGGLQGATEAVFGMERSVPQEGGISPAPSARARRRLRIPEGITREDVLEALTLLDSGVEHDFGDSIAYDLIENGRRYPPKAVLGLAARRVLGHSLRPADFTGGEKSQCFRVLRGLRFRIEPKPEPASAGTDWTEDEVRVLVEDYFAMLALQAAHTPYSKAEHRHRLTARLPGRSEGAIEYKHQNVSAVLHELEFPFIEGYKPARNYQRTMLPDIVLEHMGSRDEQMEQIEAASQSVPKDSGGATHFSRCEVPPPDPKDVPQHRAPSNSRNKPRQYDFARKDAANRALGKAGEHFVVDLERWRLRKAGRADLADLVDCVSDTQGDGAGYDVLSFDPSDGRPIYIEVKTTNRPCLTPFYVSANEVRESARLAERYWLYRVFSFSTQRKLYRQPGSLKVRFALVPKVFEARVHGIQAGEITERVASKEAIAVL